MCMGTNKNGKIFTSVISALLNLIITNILRNKNAILLKKNVLLSNIENKTH